MKYIIYCIQYASIIYVRNTFFSRPASIRFCVSIFRNFTSALISFSRSLSLIPSNSDFFGFRQHGELKIKFKSKAIAILMREIPLIQLLAYKYIDQRSVKYKSLQRQNLGGRLSPFQWKVQELTIEQPCKRSQASLSNQNIFLRQSNNPLVQHGLGQILFLLVYPSLDFYFINIISCMFIPKLAHSQHSQLIHSICNFST